MVKNSFPHWSNSFSLLLWLSNTTLTVFHFFSEKFYVKIVCLFYYGFATYLNITNISANCRPTQMFWKPIWMDWRKRKRIKALKANQKHKWYDVYDCYALVVGWCFVCWSEIVIHGLLEVSLLIGYFCVNLVSVELIIVNLE